MHKPLIATSALVLMMAFGAGNALATPDWSKAQAKKVTVFVPGVSAWEWVAKGTEHSGAVGVRKGETCASCHDDDLKPGGAFEKIVTGKGDKLADPKPGGAKQGTIPVDVKAANDGTNLYLRFEWKAPAAGAAGPDKDNPVKLAVMFAEDTKFKFGSKEASAIQVGCWATCHDDSRTMPGAKDDKKSKYIEGGSASKFYDLIQWSNGKAKQADGHVADKRVMEGGKGLVSVEGKKEGDKYVVTFTRKLAGGAAGDVALAAGKTYAFGFAIHDNSATGRYHHVSLGYTLGIDAKADINAAKQ